MRENRISVRLPRLPAMSVFADPRYSIRTDDGDALLTFDPVTRSGFVYSIPQAVWTIFAPIPFDVFVLTAADAGHAVADTAEARVWRAHCSDKAPPRAALRVVKH